MAGPGTLQQQFEEDTRRRIPERWARYEWLHALESRIGVERYQIDPGVRILYHNGTWAFVFGLYPASVAMIGAAAERWLRWLTRTTYQLQGLTRRAVSTGKVQKELGKWLDRLRELMRNPVAHGDDEVMIGVLGWTRRQPHGWTRPDEYSDMGNQPAAQEAIETFLLLLQQTIPGGP